MSQAERRIWLCADDYGISTAVSTAIRDLVARRRLNATSALVAAPSFHRAEATALDVLNSTAPRVAIGLHVTLTAPFRPLSKDFERVSGGAFAPLATTARHAIMQRFNRAALRAEVASQMQRFLETFGHVPDFVDGHHHIHLFPQICDAVLEVVASTAPKAWVRQCGRALPLVERVADPKGLLLDLLSYRFRRKALARDLRTNPAFAGTYGLQEDTDFAALFPRFLDRLPDGSVVMCHPGFVDGELQGLDSLTTLREKEYAFFGSDAFPMVLARHDVTLA